MFGCLDILQTTKTQKKQVVYFIPSVAFLLSALCQHDRLVSTTFSVHFILSGLMTNVLSRIYCRLLPATTVLSLSPSLALSLSPFRLRPSSPLRLVHKPRSSPRRVASARRRRVPARDKARAGILRSSLELSLDPLPVPKPAIPASANRRGPNWVQRLTSRPPAGR